MREPVLGATSPRMRVAWDAGGEPVKLRESVSGATPPRMRVEWDVGLRL